MGRARPNGQDGSQGPPLRFGRAGDRLGAFAREPTRVEANLPDRQQKAAPGITSVTFGMQGGRRDRTAAGLRPSARWRTIGRWSVGRRAWRARIGRGARRWREPRYLVAVRIHTLSVHDVELLLQRHLCKA